MTQSEESLTVLHKALSAVFYAVCSYFIVVVNKIVLTSYKFPSYQCLGVGQMVATVVFLFIGKNILRIITYPDINLTTIIQIFPLPLIFLFNLILGLGSTKKLSLPMFTVLRRFTILFTMIIECILLKTRPSRLTLFCIFLMIFGAFVAASSDLSFDALGYTFILLNDLTTAANMVVTKQKLKSNDLGQYGVLYYNALLMVVPMSIIAWKTGEFEQCLAFTDWANPFFLMYFLLSCFCGFILMFSMMLSTWYNSALTTTIIGVIKNLFVTYTGMFIGGDYIFNWINFSGLNISVTGSLIYTFVTFRRPKAPAPKVLEVRSVIPAQENNITIDEDIVSHHSNEYKP